MKANYSKGNVKKCAECQASMWKVVNQAAEGLALIYLLRFMQSLNYTYHFGEVMLGRVLYDMNQGDKQFSEDLADGVAFTKLLKFAKNYGLELDEDEIGKAKFAERLTEKGVVWNKKTHRGGKKIYIQEGEFDLEGE